MIDTPLQSDSAPIPSPTHQGIRSLLVSLLYFVAAFVGRSFVVEPEGIPSIWLPSGMVLAVLLLNNWRSWPSMLAAIYVADLLAYVLTNGALVPGLWFALLHCVQAVLAASLLQRYIRPGVILIGLWEMFLFVAWALIGSNALVALLGAAVSFAIFGAPFWSAWLLWWISNGFSILLVTSLILAWRAEFRTQNLFMPYRHFEVLLVYAGAIGMTAFTFNAGPSVITYPYQILPFLLWAAVRFGPRQTTALALLLSSLILWSTLQGKGLFANIGDTAGWHVIAAEGFLCVGIVSSLVLAAVTTERQQAKEALQQAFLDLERHVVERTAALTTSNAQLQREIAERQRIEAFLQNVLQQLPMGVSILEAPSGKALMRNQEAERLVGDSFHTTSADTDSDQPQYQHLDGRPYAMNEYPTSRALLTQEVVRQEEMLYQHNGQAITLSVSAAPIRDTEGEVIAVVSTFHDISQLKQMESTLAKSQLQLASIINSAMDAIITVDEEQRVTIWNAAAERTFRCSAAEALGEPLDRFIPRRYHQRHREHIATFGHTGTTTRAMGGLRPLSALRGDGEEFPIEASISQVEISGKKLYTVIMRDVTERMHAERALRTSEERFSKAFQSSPVAIVINTIADGRIVDVNDSLSRLVGRKREALLGQSISQLNIKPLAYDDAGINELVRQGGVIRDLEATIKATDGSQRAVLISAEYLELAGEECILSTIYDISERKQAEDALRESRQQIQAILDHAPALISLKGLDGRYQLVNRRLVKQLDREPDMIIGRTNSELFPADLVAILDANDQAVLEHGTPLEIEAVLPHSSGPHIYSLVTFPLTGLSGEPYALCTIAIDNTERKQLEKQLIQAQKEESIGQLAGGIAHDFNNLLTAISGYAELALISVPSDEPIASDLQEILNASDRAAALIRQLLAFARRQPIDPYVIDLNDLITDLDKLLHRLISEDIELVITLGSELQYVKADPGQIEQVIVNLVVNARDAMPGGGQLMIETANVTLDPRYAYGHLDVHPGRYVMLAVNDTGTGMTPEVQTHVFEPFFTTKEPGKGTGLGLSTCYGIIKQHGGTIWIYSEVGQGTTVKVYLPQVSEEISAVPQTQDEVPMYTGTETVLVVEDDNAVHALAVRILRSCGYTVIAASNGVEALRVAQSYLPATIHLLLTDVVMPQMGGKSTAEHITALYPDIKVLFMSGYTEHASMQHNRLDPGSPFLQKPFTPTALAEMVRTVLNRDEPPLNGHEPE